MCVFKLLIAVATIYIGSCQSTEVETALGKIKGTVLKSRLGRDFYAFRGIRYAEPPVGNLRFKNPVPVTPWKPAVFDATRDALLCPQVWNDDTAMSEDCLRLNVYTKDLNAAKPVIVYLHPGAFYFFSAQSKTFAGPEHLMDRDVVLVSLNYRIGMLGFMATNTADAPGNAGLKDQVIALRWVQKHIKDFGGDPNSVTLFGYSAGSWSIGLHMASPMAKGLFHRAIAMSAFPVAQWGYDKHGLGVAKKQAELLKCPTEHVKNMVDCLREKPMLDFAHTQPSKLGYGWHYEHNTMYYIPVVEDDFGQERYLIEDPYKTIVSGNFYKVPLITGITEYEFITNALTILTNDTNRGELNSEFDKHAPQTFLYERNTPRSKEISKRLRAEYLQNKELKMPESLEPLGQLVSDSVIGFAYHRFLNLVSLHVPVYTYLFTYKGRYSHFTFPGNQTYGAVHHDELLYLLHVSLITPLFKQTDPENDTIERLTRMWSQFAKTGNPNNRSDVYLKNLNWKLYTKTGKEYLEIGNDLKSKTGGVFEDRFRIWDELFPVPDIATFN